MTSTFWSVVAAIFVGALVVTVLRGALFTW
jgi:hypothetical protein